MTRAVGHYLAGKGLSQGGQAARSHYSPRSHLLSKRLRSADDVLASSEGPSDIRFFLRFNLTSSLGAEKPPYIDGGITPTGLMVTQDSHLLGIVGARDSG